MFDKPEIWAPVIATLLAVILGWLLGHFNLWWLSEPIRRVSPISWAKSRWRRQRARRIPIRMYPVIGESECMRQFTIKEIYALDGKGKTIADMIEPVHPAYCQDRGAGPGKAYLFALTRRARALERADSLRLVVTSDLDDKDPINVRVKVLFTDTFDLERVSSADYWDELPELQRLRIQAKLADGIMERAKPLFPFQREAHPYHGVTFAVSELEELEALFPSE